MKLDKIAIPLLSEETKQAASKTAHYAYCINCKRLYIDDLPMPGTVLCPHCDRYALHRGLTEEEIARRNLEIGSYPEPVEGPRDEAEPDTRKQHTADRRRTKPL